MTYHSGEKTTMNASDSMTLFHGTTQESASLLLEQGWAPHHFQSGSHCGNPGLIYLTTLRENALWYAQEKGSDAVITVEVAVVDLIVDPEDGVGETVADELQLSIRSGMPASLATRTPLEASRFALSTIENSPRP